VICLKGLQTDYANYLVVVSRTACLLYLVLDAEAKRVCSYIVNARKQRKRGENKYSYNLRYYFTAAKVVVLSQPLSQEKKPTEVIDQTQAETTEHHLSTTVTAIKKPVQDTVVLVTMGDSRGFVHMNTLYLK